MTPADPRPVSPTAARLCECGHRWHFHGESLTACSAVVYGGEPCPCHQYRPVSPQAAPPSSREDYALYSEMRKAGAAPPRATTPEPVPCKTPDCTLIFAHDGACIPAGSYSTYSVPTRESGALLDTSAKTLSVDEVNQILAYAHARVTEPLLIRNFTLERDAARMREAATRLFEAFNRHTAAGKTITRDIAGALVEFRATLSPSGDTERSE